MKAWKFLLLTVALALPLTGSAPKPVEEICPPGGCGFECRYVLS